MKYCNISVAEHFKYVFRQPFGYFTMPRNWLRDFSFRIMIPIVSAPVTNKNTSRTGYFAISSTLFILLLVLPIYEYVEFYLN